MLPPVNGTIRHSGARPRECRYFPHTWKSHRRDRTGWLGEPAFPTIQADVLPLGCGQCQVPGPAPANFPGRLCA